MREFELRAMQAANAKRNALMFSQWEFLNNRMIAFEQVLFESTLWQRFYFMVSPATFLAAVDAVQAELQAKGKKKMEEAAAKPNLTIVGANGHG